LALLGRVRDSYLRQARSEGWVRLDADRDRTAVAADVYAAVAQSLEGDAN
jgi:thymidylate kinase